MRLVTLCPFYDHIRPETDAALRGLEAAGSLVIRAQGTGIAKARSEMAQSALASEATHLMWVDADMGFEPRDVVKLASHASDGLDFVTGPYFQRKPGGKAVFRPLDPAEPIKLGKGGGLIEIESCGFGFVLIAREVFEKVGETLPMLTRGFRPYFFEKLEETPEGVDWIGEDIAFCQRARAAGFQLFCDMSIRLYHIGTYLYSAEDAGSLKQVAETLTLEGVAT